MREGETREEKKASSRPAATSKLHILNRAIRQRSRDIGMTDLLTMRNTPTTPTKRQSVYPVDLLRLLEASHRAAYPQLAGKTYLDHAGTTLWAKSLIDEFAQQMGSTLYGNPHSEHEPSKRADIRVEDTRRKALQFFNADPEEWDLVFTANATAAIKLVHDCFRDSAETQRRTWWYGYHKDAHTSVVGLREGTRNNRCFRSDKEVDLWIEARGLGGSQPRDIGLFAYPAQSNMTGRRLPLDWPGRIRAQVKSEVFTLLDAAALVSTAPLDIGALSEASTAPDFVALSFYKIFGFPNLGALLVKKSASRILQGRKFFGGGTVDMVICMNDNWVSKKNAEIHESLEDGTLPFTSIFALDIAIDTHRKLYGPSPMQYISTHTSRLIRMLYDDLVALRHSNGNPVIRVYNDSNATYGDSVKQGGTIAINIKKPSGDIVSFQVVEKEANLAGIHVRGGSLCNPGGVSSYLEWSPEELLAAYDEGHRCSKPLSEMFGKQLGVVRISLGAMSNEQDIESFVRFVRETYIDRVFVEDESVVEPVPVPVPVAVAAPIPTALPPTGTLALPNRPGSVRSMVVCKSASAREISTTVVQVGTFQDKYYMPKEKPNDWKRRSCDFSSSTKSKGSAMRRLGYSLRNVMPRFQSEYLLNRQATVPE